MRDHNLKLFFLFCSFLFCLPNAKGQVSTLYLPTGIYQEKEGSNITVVDEIAKDTLHLDAAPVCDIRDFEEVLLNYGKLTEEPELRVVLSEAGKEKFYFATKNNVGKKIAIIADGKLLSAPIIQSPISGGEFSISNSFSIDEARILKEKIEKEVSDIVKDKIRPAPKKELSLLLTCSSLDSAMVTMDTAKLGRLLDDNLIYFRFYHAEREKDAMLFELASGFIHYEEIKEERKPTMRFTNGSASIIRYLSIKGAYRGKAFALKLKVLEVWVWEKNQWKLFARQDLKL